MVPPVQRERESIFTMFETWNEDKHMFRICGIEHVLLVRNNSLTAFSGNSVNIFSKIFCGGDPKTVEWMTLVCMKCWRTSKVKQHCHSASGVQSQVSYVAPQPNYTRVQSCYKMAAIEPAVGGRKKCFWGLFFVFTWWFVSLEVQLYDCVKCWLLLGHSKGGVRLKNG